MICIGIVSVPGGVGGFLLGSIVIKNMALTTGHTLRAMFCMAIVCLGAMLMFANQCDTAPFAEMPSHQNYQSTDL